MKRVTIYAGWYYAFEAGAIVHVGAGRHRTGFRTMPIEFIHNTAAAPIATVLLAPGSMAPMDSPFLEAFGELLGARDLSVSRFEFAYMAARRRGGARRPPPRAEKLRDEFLAAVDELIGGVATNLPLLIGGKSLGGRVASMVADDLYGSGKISGLVCLGYPFHPPNRPDNLRTAHLLEIDCPTLIMQGERDPFGSRDEIANYRLCHRIMFHWVGDGDHDFGPRVSSGYTRRGNLAAAADALRAFVVSLQHG